MTQSAKLQALAAAIPVAVKAAERGELFESHAGLKLVEAAFDLFEADGLHDLIDDIQFALSKPTQVELRAEERDNRERIAEEDRRRAA